MTESVDPPTVEIVKTVVPLASADVRRVVLASFVGMTIEWYDSFIYGTAAALVFNKLFFPGDAAFISQMASYGSFAIGFFARPLGGIVFGHFGDRIGRKAMLGINVGVPAPMALLCRNFAAPQKIILLGTEVRLARRDDRDPCHGLQLFHTR